jgi:hypothetical protein
MSCPTVIAAGFLFLLTANPNNAYSCDRSDLLGPVKSVIVTEALVDPITAKIGGARLALRIDVSKDRAIEETTLYALESPAEPREKITSYFENGRLTRQLEAADGKTVTTTVTCSYDLQGRLVEGRIQSDNSERSRIETYEYGSGFIRRRARIFGQWKVTNQTLDALGRVVKEVTLDEAKSTVEETSEFTYSGDRQEQCSVTFLDPRRRCATTVRDSHGNEVEFLGESQTRETTFEYDSVGNWISKLTLVTRPPSTPKVETIVRRKIEYW